MDQNDQQMARRALSDSALLSQKEAAVLTGIQKGLSNKAIGKRLGITESTVKVHLRSIYNKAGVKNRTQAALWGNSQGRASWPIAVHPGNSHRN